MPRVLLAAPFSNAGKTSVCMSLISALIKQSYTIQAYKCGPDYIDIKFHEYVSKRSAANLDTYLSSEENIKELLAKDSQTCDIAVIEGVMGLFDGLGSSIKHSSAEIAKLTQTPVILVIPAMGMAASSRALIKGFQEFDSELNVAGVIFSGVKSESHAELLKEVMYDVRKIKYLGYFPYSEKFVLPSRQLGLVPQSELMHFDETLEDMTEAFLSHINMSALLKIAKSAPTLSYETKVDATQQKADASVKIGIANDEAFNFYYRSSLGALKEAGAELVDVSLLHDSELSKDLDGLYIGGGYPEEFTAEISQNKSLNKTLFQAAKLGMPIYAECGGYLYLCDSLYDCDGKKHKMAGIFRDQEAYMKAKKSDHFGYVEISIEEPNFLFKQYENYRAHEFHHAEIKNEANIFQVKKPGNNKQWRGGASFSNVLGSFAHIDFSTYPHLAQNFVHACSLYHTAKRTAEETRGSK